MFTQNEIIREGTRIPLEIHGKNRYLYYEDLPVTKKFFEWQVVHVKIRLLKETGLRFPHVN